MRDGSLLMSFPAVCLHLVVQGEHAVVGSVPCDLIPCTWMCFSATFFEQEHARMHVRLRVCMQIGLSI